MKLVLLICAASLFFPLTARANDDLEDVSHGNGLFTALSHCPFEWHDCILAIGYIRCVVDALTFWSVLSVAGRTSSSKTWLSVGNCWLCTRNDLAVD
jgi:hypothetical protein